MCAYYQESMFELYLSANVRWLYGNRRCGEDIVDQFFVLCTFPFASMAIHKEDAFHHFIRVFARELQVQLTLADLCYVHLWIASARISHALETRDAMEFCKQHMSKMDSNKCSNRAQENVRDLFRSRSLMVSHLQELGLHDEDVSRRL